MYYGGGQQTKINNASLPLPFEFVSLYLRGRTDGFALKAGDATAGVLTIMYDGERPLCSIAGTCQRHGNHTYQPMNKKGAIILATGGDSSDGASGKFYEGYMVTGVTTDATDDLIQANIVAVGYKNI
jgi:non-reducing end alpha-L-arabinofuranosidase